MGLVETERAHLDQCWPYGPVSNTSCTFYHCVPPRTLLISHHVSVCHSYLRDQLRQRIAWSLAQLLVVARGAIGVEGSHSEAFLGYYDIFVRNAFGNYRDVLREISYSPLMAENLSFIQSKSAAYTWETQNKISFADENL